MPERPLLLVAAPFRNDDDRAYEDWTAMVHLATWADGHGSCGGWSYQPGSGVIACACGASLYRVDEPAVEAEAAA